MPYLGAARAAVSNASAVLALQFGFEVSWLSQRPHRSASAPPRFTGAFRQPLLKRTTSVPHFCGLPLRAKTSPISRLKVMISASRLFSRCPTAARSEEHTSELQSRGHL